MLGTFAALAFLPWLSGCFANSRSPSHAAELRIINESVASIPALETLRDRLIFIQYYITQFDAGAAQSLGSGPARFCGRGCSSITEMVEGAPPANPFASLKKK